MLTVDVKEKVENKLQSFPCLMKSKHYGVIVLFYANQLGIVIENPHGFIGEHRKNWDMNLFTPFYGEVTLKSE